MNTLNELAFSIMDTIAPKATITEPVTIQLIKFHIINFRAQFIRNELNKSRSVDNEIIQDLGCIDLVSADRSECCDTPLDCYFLRTAVKLPGFIELHHKEAITRVGPIDKIARPYQVIPFERVPFEFYNRFTRNEIKVFLQDNRDYMYFAIHNSNILGKTLTKVNVQGVLENPQDASSFMSCSGVSCFSDDSTRFPLKGWMASAITSSIIKMFVGPEQKEPIDVNHTGETVFTPVIRNK